jgi:hypothetical protein
MAALKLENKKVPVEIDGVVYQLTKFKAGHVREAQRLLSEGQESQGLQFQLDALVKSGLPQEIVDALDLDLLAPLNEALGLGKK